MEKCNFLKILQCPDFENLWGDSWHLFQPEKLDESDGGFCFLRIIFSSHVPLMRLFLTKRLIVQIRLFCLFPPFSPLFVFSTLPSLSLPALSIANTVTRSTHQYYWSIADIFHWYILSIQYKIKFLIKHWGWSRFFFISSSFSWKPKPHFVGARHQNT